MARLYRTDHASGRAVEPGDRGFVLTWFALFLVVLMAMAGFSVDVWNWWYTAQRAQNAADAAALGGVVYLPDDVEADAQAKSIAVQNGFTAAETSTTVGPNLNTLEVSVGTTVNNFFTSLFGIATTDISRDATAEFTGDVPMGSPKNFLGNDPDEGEKPDHWLSVSGYNSDKQGGDRYQSFPCNQTPIAAYCTSNQNDEYDDNGYVFHINTAGFATGPLNIEIFDPMHNAQPNQNCDNSGSNTLRLPAAWASYADLYNAIDAARGTTDSATRFHAGQGVYCLGDSGAADDAITTYIIRAPDSTPANDLDNPLYASGSCVSQYGSINEDVDWLQILHDVATGIDTDPEHVVFEDTFRQWDRICSIPAATVNGFRALYGDQTDFLLQVRSNSPDGSACTNPPACDSAASTNYQTNGRNHFSIRAGYGDALAGDVRVFANGRLPMHAASTGANTQFFLARVGSAQAGRFLQVEFFDTGDASSSGTITILQPDEVGDGSFNESFIPFTTCTFESTGGPTTSAGCSLLNVVNNSTYQGQVVTATVSIPDSYSCQDANPLGCWVKLRFAYPAGTNVSDHTVWSAGIVGDPVRLTD